MTKYSDTKRAQRGSRSKYNPGEPAQARHARRWREARDAYPEILEWCNANGFKLIVKNDWHHWKFRSVDYICDWWPSSAKLVIAGDYENGIHCHDWKQVAIEIRGDCDYASNNS